ncbi:MAG TPA: DUF362 domain-containing protein [Candidatus Omnitrophota bacterium]|nr:DUF362 domain-containing protein [Candidatus Omnitrophota bacterium]HPT07345.1 DUF362 domain-containing protein [Candidatus Omnitrophota bacterium]
MKPRVSIVRCQEYERNCLEAALGYCLELCGGIGAFVKPNSRVLVKPNLLMANGPECGVCTHPEVVRAVVRLLKKHGCTVFVGDGPSVWGAIQDVNVVYEASGVKKVCDEEGVSLVQFDKRRWHGKFPLAAFLDEVDHLVSVAKFKTHEFTTLTAAVKNNFGLVSGTFKTELHKKYYDKNEFANILLDVYRESNPSLTIVDGIIAMEGDGPSTSGTLRNQGILVAGRDCVAIDSVLATVMGLKPIDIVTNREGARRKIGVADVQEIDIQGETIDNVKGRPFTLPVSSVHSRIPQPVISFVKRFLYFRPAVNHKACVRCGACIEACPQKVIRKVKGKIVIDYSRCISCFCCQEMCPHSAIQVKKSLLAKLLKL